MAAEPVALPSRPLVAVLAMARNGAIGRDGGLPWTLPSDLARFRALTMGTPMIMGRRTFEAIGRALPDRDSVVVSSSSRSARPADRIYATRSIDEALAVADSRAAAMGAPDITVIGGALIFDALLPLCARLHLTVVDLRPEADTFLRYPDPYVWRETARQASPRGAGDDADCVFLTFERA